MKNVDLIVFADSLITCPSGEGPKRGEEIRNIGIVSDGAVAVNEGIIEDIGSSSEILSKYSSSNIIKSKLILPSLVDAHTHPVFAGSRINEYALRSKGASYLEIMRAGGGISGTVKSSVKASTEELLQLLLKRLDRMFMHGTGCIEAKSGYGLSAKEEIRQLEVLKQASSIHPMDIVPTFLGAHALPEEYASRRDYYVDLVIKDMIPEVAERNLAVFADVFCEQGAFTMEETEKIFSAAIEHGLKIRVHSEQFNSSGASLKFAKMGAYSCDHLLRLSIDDIKEIAKYDTVCMFLPSSEFFLNVRDYGLMREAIDLGAAVGLATDFNAGSCLSESLPMTMSIAVIQMKVTPEEAISASTVNAAFSVGKHKEAGTLTKGRKADMISVNCGDYKEWLYHFGVNMVDKVIKNGVVYDKEIFC